MPTVIRPRRTVLFMPGSNPRALERAKTLPADALIFDLEDAVAPDAKETARQMVGDAICARGYGSRELIIRVNAQGTPWGDADLAAVATCGADAVLLPKVENGKMVRQAGKSTVLTHLALCFATHALEPRQRWLDQLTGWPPQQADLVPPTVVLRDFARWLPPKAKEAEPRHLRTPPGSCVISMVWPWPRLSPMRGLRVTWPAPHRARWLPKRCHPPCR